MTMVTDQCFIFIYIRVFRHMLPTKQTIIYLPHQADFIKFPDNFRATLFCKANRPGLQLNGLYMRYIWDHYSVARCVGSARRRSTARAAAKRSTRRMRSPRTWPCAGWSRHSRLSHRWAPGGEAHAHEQKAAQRRTAAAKAVSTC
jgi:hypothetical protein